MMDANGRRCSRSILIVFPDDWAPFSPTTTRLVDYLSRRFKVQVLAFDSGRFDLSVLDRERYTRVRIHPRLATFLRTVGLLRVARTILLAIRTRLLASNADHVIAVDNDGAIACWLAGRRMHYLSLEVARPSIASWLVPRSADSIVIQTKERLEYQFRYEAIAGTAVFLIQNAPNAPPDIPVTRRCDPLHAKLVYMGNMIPTHGLLRMLNLMRIWPGATLHLQGIASAECMHMMRSNYGDLMDAERISIGSHYLDESQIMGFLVDFDIGICLYEPPEGGRMNFNYESSPSGKMFNYFAAGLPVLASRHVGLNPVTTFSAGIQSPSNDAEDLLAAGLALCHNHSHYREGAIRAARAFDFSSSADHFAAYLGSDPTPR